MPSYYSGYANQYRLRLDITQGTQSIANNTSVVSWTLYLTSGNRSISANSIYSATVNGVTSPNENPKSVSIGLNSTVNLGSGSTTVTHNSNGTKSVAFSASFKTRSNIYDKNGVLVSPGSTMTISGSLALTTIPRYTTVTNPSISSITRSGYKFSFSAGNTIDRWEYSSNGGSWTLGQTGDRTSGEKTLSGFGANTKPTIKVKVRRKDSQLWTESGTVTATLESTASPNTPTITDATRDSFKINVTANKSFNGFQYNLDGGTWSAKQSGTSVPVTGRAAGTTYIVRVKVYDGVHTSSLSGQSSAVNATTVAAASPNTPTFSSKTAIQVVFNWSSNRTVTNVQYKRWSSDSWQSAGNDFSAKTSGSVTVKDLSPNTGYSIRVRVKDAVKGTWSGESGALSVTTYALSTVKGANFNLGSNVTATVTEADTAMYHDITLEANYGGSWQQVASVTNQNKDASLTIPAATVTAIENGTPSSKTVSMRLKVTTKWGSGGTVQGPAQTSPTFTANIVNANPTLSGITYKDNHSNTDFVAWKGGDQKILRNVSPVMATLGTATAIKGATLSRYVFNVNGKSFTVNANGTKNANGEDVQTGAIRDLGVIDSATNQNIDVTVYDSRNNSTPMSVPVSMLDYIPPQVLEIEAQRENNYEPATTLVVSGRSYIVKPTAAADNVNTYTAKYRMKEAGTSTWPAGYTNVTTTKSNESGNWQNYSVSHYMGTFDSDKSYDIEFVFQDSVGTQYTQNAVLTKGIGLMTFLEDKVELGVPLYDKNSTKKYMLEGEGGTDVVTVLKAVYPVGAIYTSVTATNPATIFGFGTWAAFGAGRTIVGVNTSDTDFNTVEKTGGSKTNTLAITNLPAHTHTFTGNATGSAGNHSHTITVDSGGSHSHTASSNTTGAHTHSISGTAASAGAHTHNPHNSTIVNDVNRVDWYTSNAGTGWYPQGAVSTNTGFPSKSAGAHTHSVSGTAASAGAHSHTITVASGGAHAHTASSNSTGAHTHTVSGSNANTGSGTAFNTVDPYITVYMWKRTA